MPDYHEILESIPGDFRGPGGAIAIIHDGELAASRVWGYSNIESRIPMTSSTIMPICSISKQMVCYCLASMARDSATSSFNTQAAVNELLPNLPEPESRAAIQNLKNMSSGLRDYWALTTLWGAQIEGRFTMNEHAPKMRERIKSSHFEPGTQYSYSNTNWHVLGLLAEKQAGKSLDEVLKERLFKQADMTTAQLGGDTSALSGGAKGYEGDEPRGFTEAVNRIVWEGDAGIVMSLDDMIAYEKFCHRSWDETDSIYRELAEEQKFADGRPSRYGNGLARGKIAGFTTLGHGGGLRGWSLHRLHIPEKGLSAIVMFNHMANAAVAAGNILKKLLEVPPPKPWSGQPSKDWEGTYLDEKSQRAIPVALGKDGKVSFGNRRPETATLVAADRAESADMKVKIDGDVLEMERIVDNANYRAKRLKGTLGKGQAGEYAGDFRCEEIDSNFHCTGEGRSGMLYGSFDGFLGKGPGYTMRYVGDDVWLLANPRAMDDAPPGDWTLVFGREGDGKVKRVTIGCWLARRLEYVKS